MRHSPQRQIGTTSPRLTAPATKTAGNESAKAIGSAAARLHSQTVLSGRLSHSTASAMSTTAANRSQAYGLALAHRPTGALATARQPTAKTIGTPASRRD